MKNRVLSTLLTAVLGTLVLLGVVQAQDQAGQGEQILQTLVAFDQAFLSSYELVLEASYPTTPFDTTQGYCAATVRITGDGTRAALECRQTKMDAPRYAENRIGPDYEENGDYVLNFTKNLYALLGPDSCKTRIDQERQSIDRTGAVARSLPTSPFYEIRPAGNLDSKNRVYRYLLPLGRGFSELLSEVTSEELLDDGSLRIEATGSLFSPNVGIWVLEVDPANEYLVRNARFTRKGGEDSAIVVCDPSGGTAEGALPLWKSGRFDLAPNYDITVRLAECSGKPNLELLSQVESAVNTVAEKSTLLDFNSLDDEGKPLVIRGLGAPQ